MRESFGAKGFLNIDKDEVEVTKDREEEREGET